MRTQDTPDSSARPRILHIANWYPNPWNPIEGNFVRDHIRLFREVVPAEAVVVQVRCDPSAWLRLRRLDLGEGVRGYFLLCRLRSGSRSVSVLTTLLLLAVFLRYRAWRFSALHVHIAIPLLAYVGLWHWLLRRPIMISEHWSAYHYRFHLPSGARGLAALRRPFARGFPVIAVSRTLLDDIRRFAERDDFPGFVLPNKVPLHGASEHYRTRPVLFAVNFWGPIKDPMPMLEGLALAAHAGVAFDLLIGGFGPLEAEMRAFVTGSSLAGRTRFLGLMTKEGIARELASADGYLFSSRYETFSVACAEALGAGVPLIGPKLAAVAEYAGPDDWVQVGGRDAVSWEEATRRFVARQSEGGFDSAAIARRAAERFSTAVLVGEYRSIVEAVVPGVLQ